MNRNGYGIEYEIENGKEKIEGYWCKDRLIRMIREFDAENNQMIEYTESKEDNDNMKLLNRIPIYIGGYCIENGKYVRNGVGYLIDEGVEQQFEKVNGKMAKRRKNAELICMKDGMLKE